MNEAPEQTSKIWDGFGGDDYDRPPPPPRIARTREGIYYRKEPDGAKADIGPSFAAVILHSRLERSWFLDGRKQCGAVQLQPGQPMTITGSRPPADACRECPQNRSVSSDGQCKAQRKFVLLPVTKDGPVGKRAYVFYASGMALVPYTEYEDTVRAYKRPVQAAVTKFVNVDRDTKSFGVVKAAGFEFGRWLDEAESERVIAAVKDTKDLMAVPNRTPSDANAVQDAGDRPGDAQARSQWHGSGHRQNAAQGRAGGSTADFEREAAQEQAAQQRERDLKAQAEEAWREKHGDATPPPQLADDFLDEDVPF